MPLASQPPFTEGINEKTLKRVVPSWMISLVLHALVLLFLLLGIHRSGRPDGDPNSSGAFQIIGSRDKTRLGPAGGFGSDGPDQTGQDAAAAKSGPLTESLPVIISKQEEPAAAASVPVNLLSLPDTSSVGAAMSLPPSASRPKVKPRPSGLPPGIRELIANQGKGRGKGVGSRPGSGVGKGNGGGSSVGFGDPNGTSFFSMAAQGDRFCYVVDSSASMDGAAMGMARAELMASIERLDSTKRFQIFFYNSELHPMTNGREDIFYATEINRTFARQFINNQQPDSSTAHMPALVAALARAPDVIFFLTDGDIPDLKANELKELVKLNRNNTQIFVVQFGEGPKLGPPNWLEKLAKDHHGSYNYHDINDAFRKQ